MPRMNPKPLSILVMDKGIYQSEAIKRFMAKGHTVDESTYEHYEDADYDVVIGPKCWRIDPRMKLGDDRTEDESLERQLEMMEAGVRAIKFPKQEVPK